jgi:hypothetical protein
MYISFCVVFPPDLLFLAVLFSTGKAKTFDVLPPLLGGVM